MLELGLALSVILKSVPLLSLLPLFVSALLLSRSIILVFFTSCHILDPRPFLVVFLFSVL